MHQSIIRFLTAVRYSFHDAPIVYTRGGCYGMYQILKEVYPSATAYFEDADKEHILTKIEGRYYDINGEYPFILTDKKELKRLSKVDHEYWRTVASGQRLEVILAKYERYCNHLRKLD